MLDAINDFLSGKVLIPLVLGLGSYFTIRSKFVQFRYFAHMVSVLHCSWHTGNHHLSSFQALTLSLAGRVGTGNIVGVGIAVSMGGPGAVFWMWMTALLVCRAASSSAHWVNSISAVMEMACIEGDLHGTSSMVL